MSDKDERFIFANNLREILNEKGISQQQLADAVGVSKSAVSFWLSATKYPTPGKIQKAADFLGVRKSQLIDDVPAVSFRVDLLARKLEQLTPSQLDIVERMIDALLS